MELPPTKKLERSPAKDEVEEWLFGQINFPMLARQLGKGKKQELQRRKTLLDAYKRGEKRGVQTEIQKYLQQSQEGLKKAQAEFKPMGQLMGDETYQEMKNEIQTGQTLLDTISFSQAQKDWMGRRINELQSRQDGTKRGQLIKNLKSYQSDIDKFNQLLEVTNQK